MALTESVQLDIQNALRQISELERAIDQVAKPVDIPINVSGADRLASELDQAEGSTDRLNRELRETDDALDRVGREGRQAGDELERAGKKGTSAFSGLGKLIGGLAIGTAAIAGLRAFVGFAGEAVSAASDLEESTSKVEVVFGDLSGEIKEFASTAPQALGLSTAAALEMTGTFGNLFTALGLSQQAARDLAPEIVQLGADLASFNNIEVQDALDKLRAGLVGEAEPLRALGVNLTAAATAAKAVELGLAASTTSVSEAAKVQARYALILEQTTTAQGDFARTSDGLANQQRTLAGEFENLRAEIGTELLPTLGLVVETLSSALPQISRLASGVGRAFLEVADAVGLISDEAAGLQRISQNFEVAADSAQALGTAAGLVARSLPAITRERGRFGESIDEIELFREEIVKLLEVSGAAPAELRKLQDALPNLSGVFEPEQIAVFTEEINRLLVTTGGFSTFSEGERFVAQFGATVSEAGNRIRHSDLSPELREVANAANEASAAAAAFDLGPIEQEIDRTIGQLPTALDAARSAMRDDENEIVADFGDFLDNLQSELTARDEFNRNLNILENMGFSDLAAQFRELGFSEEIASLLAQAIDDPSSSAEAEAAIDRYNDRLAEFWRQDLLQSLLSQVTDPFQIPFNIEGIINSINIPGIGQGLIENIQIGTGTPNLPPGGGGGGGSNLPLGGGNVVVEQNFYTQAEPDTATERLKQAVRAI